MPPAINPTGCARTEPKLRTHFRRLVNLEHSLFTGPQCCLLYLCTAWMNAVWCIYSVAWCSAYCVRLKSRVSWGCVCGQKFMSLHWVLTYKCSHSHEMLKDVDAACSCYTLIGHKSGAYTSAVFVTCPYSWWEVCERSEMCVGVRLKHWWYLISYRPHTLQSTNSRSLPSTVTGVTGDFNSPYMKQFVHSKSQQYRRLKTDWKTLVYLGRSRIQASVIMFFFSS